MNSYIYCKKRNTLFCHIEKNGCESIRYLILKEENEENPTDVFSIKVNKYLYNSKNIHQLQEKNPNVILISRNPYSRIISGFNDKVLSDYQGHGLPYIKNIMNLSNNDINKRINFEEFLNYIVKDDIHNMDNHFKPQYTWLEDIKIFKNIKIFKLKDISKINTYLKELNFDNILENFLKLHFNPNLYRGDHLIKRDIPNVYKLHYDIFKEDIIRNNFIPLHKNYFNNDLKEKFINKYKKDFDLFNYSIFLSSE